MRVRQMKNSFKMSLTHLKMITVLKRMDKIVNSKMEMIKDV